MVVGGPDVEGVGLAVDVAVGVPLVVVAVAIPAVGVTVTGAWRSRKTTNGLLHQCRSVSATSDGVGFCVGVALPPPPLKFNPEQESRKKLDNSKHVDTNSPANRQRATNDKNCGRNIKKTP